MMALGFNMMSGVLIRKINAGLAGYYEDAVAVVFSKYKFLLKD